MIRVESARWIRHVTEVLDPLFEHPSGKKNNELVSLFELITSHVVRIGGVEDNDIQNAFEQFWRGMENALSDKKHYIGRKFGRALVFRPHMFATEVAPRYGDEFFSGFILGTFEAMSGGLAICSEFFVREFGNRVARHRWGTTKNLSSQEFGKAVADLLKSTQHHLFLKLFADSFARSYRQIDSTSKSAFEFGDAEIIARNIFVRLTTQSVERLVLGYRVQQ